MSSTLLTPPAPLASTTATAVVVLQGADPRTGHLATWHLTPVGSDAGAEWQVERVAGYITHPAVWMQATKETSVVTAAEAQELQLRVRSA